jgi:hypothetical protein
VCGSPETSPRKIFGEPALCIDEKLTRRAKLYRGGFIKASLSCNISGDDKYGLLVTIYTRIN